ncbi:12683_t:CDS:1, partial [Dentiscutata erythropus]
ELENEEPTEPIYTTIQVGNTFSQLNKQLIANVKIENVNNPLNPPSPNIFKLIQLEINEIKDKRKEAQKVPIHITENKSTFIRYTLNNSQQQIITQLL